MSARDEVVAATERRTRALVERDAEALLALHHPDLRFTTPRADVRPRRYIAGNTEGDLVWRAQLMPRSTSSPRRHRGPHGARATTSSSAAAPGRARRRLTLTWLRADGAWRVLAGHATLSPD